MRSIRIGHLSTAYHTAFVLMGDGSIEKRMPVKAHWRLFPTGPDIIKAFQGGELDIGYLGLPPAMIGIQKGVKIKCVAGGHVEGTILTAGRQFRTLRESGEMKKTLMQFEGKTIGTPSKGSIHDVLIRHLIEEAGLRDKVSIKNFEWADFIIEAMEENVVDAGCGTPPLAVLASRFLNTHIILPPNAIWAFSPSYGILASERMIEDSGDELEQFLKLHEDACNLMRLKPQKAAKLAAQAIGIVTKDFLLDVFKVSPKYCASLPREYVESSLAFVSILLKMGYMTNPLKEEDIFQKKFIDRIHKEEPHYDNPGKLV